MYNSFDIENVGNSTITGCLTQNDHDITSNATATTSVGAQDIHHSLRNSPHKTSRNRQSECTAVPGDFLSCISHIEQILNFYRQELGEETNTVLTCDHLLIRRFVDLLLAANNSNETRKNGLHKLFNDIKMLQEKKFQNVKEDQEKLQTEVSHLRKLLVSSTNDDRDHLKPVKKLGRLDSMIDLDEWLKVDEETKQLNSLVERQQHQIGELVRILEEGGYGVEQIVADQNADENSLERPNANISDSDSGAVVTRRANTSGLQKTDAGTNMESITHASRGSFDFASLRQIFTKSFINGSDDDMLDDEHQLSNIDNNNRPSLGIHATFDNITACPICHQLFADTANHVEMSRHVDECCNLADTGDLKLPSRPAQYECPRCHKKFFELDDQLYCEHLSICYTEN